LVCNSKCGDKICLYATSKYFDWTVKVKEVAVCVVHTSKWEVGQLRHMYTKLRGCYSSPLGEI
jgi:hypothetical protein